MRFASVPWIISRFFDAAHRVSLSLRSIVDRIVPVGALGGLEVRPGVEGGCYNSE